MQNKNWRIALPAVIAAASMALAGCGAAGNGGNGGEVKASDGDVTITLNWWGSNNRIKLTEEAVAAFEKLHPNIHVEMSYSDNSGYWDKLATSIAGKEMPDVIQMDEQYLASYSSQGVLYDMNGLGEYLKSDDIDKTLLDTGKVDGAQYAMPIASTMWAVSINNDLLNKYGITLPDTETWTWDDFEKVCKEVVAKSGGSVIGSVPNNNPMSLQLWARQHGDSLYKDGKMAIKPETLASYLQMAYDWSHGENAITGSPDRTSEQIVTSFDQSDMAKGNQAFGFVYTNQFNTYMKTLGENLTLAPLPSDDNSIKWSYLKPSMYWSIAAGTEHPAEAAMLVDYLVNNVDAGKILGIERGIPANKTVRETLMQTTTGGEKVALEFHAAQADKQGDAPDITPNGASSLIKTTQRYEQQVAFGDLSATDAANQMIKEMQNEIDTAS